VFVRQLFSFNRKREIDLEKRAGMSDLEARAMVDVTWSDPENVAKFGPNPRGKGMLFGPVQTKNFLWNNRFLRGGETKRSDPRHAFVARSHQVAEEGWQWFHQERTLTVWSAPKYAYRANNDACVLKVEKDKPIAFVKFDSDPRSPIKPDDQVIAYFA
jgi:diadenosine tetraphosphatase ApaH/serine/threonine PP2A family protein phosphatase